VTRSVIAQRIDTSWCFLTVRSEGHRAATLGGLLRGCGDGEENCRVFEGCHGMRRLRQNEELAARGFRGLRGARNSNPSDEDVDRGRP